MERLETQLAYFTGPTVLFTLVLGPRHPISKQRPGFLTLLRALDFVQQSQHLRLHFDSLPVLTIALPATKLRLANYARVVQ